LHVMCACARFTKARPISRDW